MPIVSLSSGMSWSQADIVHDIALAVREYLGSEGRCGGTLDMTVYGRQQRYLKRKCQYLRN